MVHRCVSYLWKIDHKSEQQKSTERQWSRQQKVLCGTGSLRGEDLSSYSIYDHSEVQARGCCDWLCVVPICTWTPHRVTLLGQDKFCSPFLWFAEVCLPHFPAGFLQVFFDMTHVYLWTLSTHTHTHTSTGSNRWIFSMGLPFSPTEQLGNFYENRVRANIPKAALTLTWTS